MKPRRVMITVEVETDLSFKEIKEEVKATIPDKVWNVIQVQVNVVRSTRSFRRNQVKC